MVGPIKQPFRTPVILDTDIGGDIDDTWALAMLLKSPELDVKLVTAGTGDTVYRARIVAKMLETAGRADIPVGIGTRQNELGNREAQAPWVERYDLAHYPGVVCQDGVKALVEIVMNSPQPITLICIGPLTNIREALRREPAIAARARIVGMFGCLRRSHEGSPAVIAEYNVVKDVPACQTVFDAPWPITITPLDTCGVVRLRGEKYRRVLQCGDPLIRAVIENYGIWLKIKGDPASVEVESSILFDTVAVHLAMSSDFLVMKDMGVRVDDTGFMRADDSARAISVAVEWTDLPAYEDALVARLTREQT